MAGTSEVSDKADDSSSDLCFRLFSEDSSDDAIAGESGDAAWFGRFATAKSAACCWMSLLWRRQKRLSSLAYFDLVGTAC